jgi:hypothetical protein
MARTKSLSSSTHESHVWFGAFLSVRCLCRVVLFEISSSWKQSMKNLGFRYGFGDLRVHVHSAKLPRTNVETSQRHGNQQVRRFEP